MAFAMQPGPSSVVPGTGTAQRFAEGAVAIADEQEQISIHGHNWLLCTSDIRRMYICTICSDAAAERTLCAETAHAVCDTCRTQMEQRKIDRCPSCRGTFTSSGQRSFHDSILKQQQIRVLQHAASIDCAECGHWSGVEDGMKKHAQLCPAVAGLGTRKQPVQGKETRAGSQLHTNWRRQQPMESQQQVMSHFSLGGQFVRDAARAEATDSEEEAMEVDGEEETGSMDSAAETRSAGGWSGFILTFADSEGNVIMTVRR
ncbi:MAG: hypothetical protein OXC07_05335 [Kistimonas sp.]|nr:hypothetical protein [Kistimonas sp.]